jgi:NAD(P)-dependent dehydrogenase (short-subunit alcohol dehydrogenase family)
MQILITGVSSGLGKALVKKNLARGDFVVGIARDELDSLSIRELTENKNFFYVRCDLADIEDIDNLFEILSKKSLSIDKVILNAAIMCEDVRAGRFDYATFKKTFEVNLFGSIYIVHKLLPVFQKKGRGMFVAISSLSSLRPIVVERIGYPASKAALGMAFEGFRIQVNHPGIRFVTINLGRMSDKQGLMCVTYEKAAQKIISVIAGKADYINYPLTPTLFTRIFRHLPDWTISRYLIPLITNIRKKVPQINSPT